MNLERANERAHTVSGHKTAARLYNDIEYELALGEPETHLEIAAEQALTHLERRFPGIRNAARQIEDPPNLSRAAIDALHGARRRTPQPRSSALQREHAQAGLPPSSWNRLYAYTRAHPARATAIIPFVIIVAVKLWTYIVLGMITFVAIKAYQQR